MIRDVNLLEYLPPFVQEYVEMQQIMQAENPYVQKLEDETEIIKNNQFIQSCNLTGIRKFEELLKIIPSNVDTLESRRSRVLTRWNDVVPYTKQTLQQKLDTLCGKGNYTMKSIYDEYAVDIITHLELAGQVDELDYFLSFMIPANIVLTSRNEMNLGMSGNTVIASGMCLCETFELSDNFKKDVNINGSVMLGGGTIGADMIDLSDAYQKDVQIDSSASFAGDVVNTVSIEISDQFNETIQISGQSNVASNVSVTEIL